MALLQSLLAPSGVFPKRSFGSDSGFSADDSTAVDPIAAGSEITSLTSNTTKSVAKPNTRQEAGPTVIGDLRADNRDGVADEEDDDEGIDGSTSEQDQLVISFGDDAVSSAHHLSVPVPKKSVYIATSRIKASWLDNTYQKALARARARLAKGHWPQDPEEWRLPNAPLPAKPDYTRTGPVLSLPSGYLVTQRKRREARTRSETFPGTSKENKAAARQAHLPPIDRIYDSLFANLSASYPSHLLRKRWEVAAGAPAAPASLYDQSTYLPFTGSANLHPKELTPTVRRDDSQPPPKFCYGCAAELERMNKRGEYTGPFVYLDQEGEDSDVTGDIAQARLAPTEEHAHVAESRICDGCSRCRVPQ
ncbi:uncharacterized protein [Diadema antillarum]|uniref:uncharacterized protein n=1 Tax=Diadema antillarum TaxID=105358 RepID=UPI003A87BA12